MRTTSTLGSEATTVEWEASLRSPLMAASPLATAGPPRPEMTCCQPPRQAQPAQEWLTARTERQPKQRLAA